MSTSDEFVFDVPSVSVDLADLESVYQEVDAGDCCPVCMGDGCECCSGTDGGCGTPEHTDADEAESQTIPSPVTGEPVNLGDIDSLLRGLYANRLILEDVRDFDSLLRRVALDKTEGDTVTRRLRGESLQAKVTLPGVKYDGRTLLELWAAYPQFRDQFLAIERVKVKAREVAKLAAMATDDPAFAAFRESLLAACRGREGLPTVKVEEIE